MKVIDDDDASLLPKIGADGFPLGGTVTRARDYSSKRQVTWDAIAALTKASVKVYFGRLNKRGSRNCRELCK